MCAQVREAELRSVIAAGASSLDDVAGACGATTGCGCCEQRVIDALAAVGRTEVSI